MSSWRAAVVGALALPLASGRAAAPGTPGTAGSSPLRPPAAPLLVHDPFFSVWQQSDNLTDTWATFWSGPITGMAGIVMVDQQPCRWMGLDTYSEGGNVPPCQQLGLPEVTATQTQYRFQALADVELTAKFTTPVLGDQLDFWIDNPASYITIGTRSTDNRAHSVKVYFSFTAELAVSDVSQRVRWQRDAPHPVDGLHVLRIGTEEQKVLGQSGDGIRISWGHHYLAVPGSQGSPQTSVGNNTAVARAFLAGQPLPADAADRAQACQDNWPVMAVAWDLGTLPAGGAPVAVFAVTAYDQVKAMNYYGTALEPAWTHGGTRLITEVLEAAAQNHEKVLAMCAAFDAKLYGELLQAGGAHYADVTVLTHRQIFGAVVYTSVPANLPAECRGSEKYWAFMEEMSSDGDVSTVDVLYPAAPAVLYFSPELMWTLMVPVLAYAGNCTASPYAKPFAPHDLGTWPIADRPFDKQEDMPLEESGNMLILAQVVAAMLKSTSFVLPYQWSLFDSWVQYVNGSLPNPPVQLCTDDFEGPTPNNTNLALKGITALNAWASLLDSRGKGAEASEYRTWATSFVSYWMTNALDTTNGVRYKRDYDLPAGTSFSLKYNSIFGYFLGYQDQPSWFPSSMMETEFAYYATYQRNPFGVPLDDRKPFTLVEYMGSLLGVAGVIEDATGNSTYREMLTQQLYAFTGNTLPRVPMTDWYDTTNGKLWGFRARATVGDFFALVLLRKKEFGLHSVPPASVIV